MSGRYSVQVHQADKEPSVKSGYSCSSAEYASSNSSTPRSYSPSTSGASGSSRNAVVHNLNTVSYDKASPSPKYAGGYSKP